MTVRSTDVTYVYQRALDEENEMRRRMYDSSFRDHPMNRDQHYQLIRLDPETWDNLLLKQPNDPSWSLFLDDTNTPRLEKTTIAHAKRSLHDLRPLFTEAGLGCGVVVAGGAVVSALFGHPRNDVDLFLYGYDQEAAIEKTKELVVVIANQFHRTEPRSRFTRYVMVTRTAEAVTVVIRLSRNKGAVPSIKVFQVILRLYRTKSEVIHGFDVDACSVLYDGVHFYATQRAMASFQDRCIRVNFDRMSPSYEYRLAKYALRGFAIVVPPFVGIDLQEERRREREESVDLSRIRGYDGLRYLLFVERLWDDYSRNVELFPFDTITRDGMRRCQDYNRGITRGFQPIIRIGGQKEKEHEVSLLVSTPISTNRIIAIRLSMITDLVIWGTKDEVSQRPFTVSDAESILQMSSMVYQRICTLFTRQLRDIKVIPHDEVCPIGDRIHFKTTLPGEQMTSTFHRRVFADRLVWYRGVSSQE